MTKPTAECEQCGNPFPKTQKTRRFCSRGCNSQSYKEKIMPLWGLGSRLGIATGTTGAIGELLIAADLMRLRYEVFRALSQSTSCDLLAFRNGKMYRIEVRTAYRLPSQKLTYSKSDKDHGKSDHYGLVVWSDESHYEIIYEPPLSAE
jgi:hypothetical protein